MKRTISELTIRLLVVEEESPPSFDAETTGEALEDEVSVVRSSPLRPLAKATSRLAQVVPLFRKAAG
jgi:hypothetical protein